MFQSIISWLSGYCQETRSFLWEWDALDSYLWFQQRTLLVLIHLLHIIKHRHGSFHASKWACITGNWIKIEGIISYYFFNCTCAITCQYVSIQCAACCGLLFGIKWVLLHSQSISRQFLEPVSACFTNESWHEICQSFKDILLPSFANYKLYKKKNIIYQRNS